MNQSVVLTGQRPVAAAGMERPQKTPKEWHERRINAARRYEEIGFEPGLLDAVSEGLAQWAALLPQVEVDVAGRHKQVNSWGLEPERLMLWHVEMLLSRSGHRHECGEIKRMGAHLNELAERLDSCYPKVSTDEEEAEARLVMSCRGLVTLLRGALVDAKRLCYESSRPSKHVPLPACTMPGGTIVTCPPERKVRKRSSRAAAIEALVRELIEHISAAQAHARFRLDTDGVEDLLPRPTKSQLGQRANVPDYTVSRCFQDDGAHQLRLLWRIADDYDAIIRGM